MRARTLMMMGVNGRLKFSPGANLRGDFVRADADAGGLPNESREYINPSRN